MASICKCGCKGREPIFFLLSIPQGLYNGRDMTLKRNMRKFSNWIVEDASRSSAGMPPRVVHIMVLAPALGSPAMDQLSARMQP